MTTESDAMKVLDNVDAKPSARDSPAMRGMETVKITEDENKHRYNMNHPQRGMAIIINNKTFDKRTGMNERSGTDIDAAALYQRFKAWGLEVQVHHNQSCTEMLRIFTRAAQADHRDSDCFVAAMMSHGDEGIIYGTDSIIQIDTLVAPFKGDRCHSLAGKPKLFFIQACRGTKLDHGVEVADSVDSDIHRIPAEADFLMAYSVVPGYFSWRNSVKGSWFVQALNRVIEEYGNTKEILWMMTRVNYEVSFEFESNASKEFMNHKKQVPCIVSMLTKELYFPPL
eukprot:GHVU01063859.1.p1 GENE.GHVU01063859.1~~GHVU01063859.1.p1  ORF type:complete len:283 (+),score=41.73 GHVU01063859.1:123-971(+)